MNNVKSSLLFVIVFVGGLLLIHPNQMASAERGKIVFTLNREGNEEIYIINDDSKNLRRLTHHPAVDKWPVWLPDGRRIAFCSDRDGVFSIYTMDLAGKNIKRIVDSGDIPVISPAGQWIAVSHVRGRLQRNPSLLLVDIEGLMQREILLRAPVGFYGMIDWSPDGKRLAFTIRTPEVLNDIYVVDINGENLRQLTEDPAQDLYPAWSPDGQWIAFWSNREGGNAVYLMDADGANPKRLANGRSPEWAPDGQQIAFVSRQDDLEGIFIMDTEGENIKLLVEGGNQPAWFGSKLAVSDIGKRITFWGRMKRGEPIQ